MICLHENVCFLHNIQLQGLCVSPPVNKRVCEKVCEHAKSSVLQRECVKGSQASINHTEFSSFPPHCLSPQSKPLTLRTTSKLTVHK